MRLAVRARILLTAGLVAGLASGCGDADPDAGLAAGPHLDLACGECHAGPVSDGFVASLAPGSCARCHPDAELNASVEVHNVSLTHIAHPGVADSGPSGCVACHTHDSGDVDLTIASGSCFLCHAVLAQGAEATISESDCAACHVQPAHTGFPTGGATIDHAAVLERGVSCLLCHYDVIEGTGATATATCRTCHGMPGGAAPLRGDESMDAAAVHALHPDTAAPMSCTRCHEPIDHTVIQMASSLTLECESCHAPGDPALNPPVDSSIHRRTQQLYAGFDPDHPDVEPALKFLERVSCSGCHVASATALQAGSAERLGLIRQECAACHGERFGPLLGPWVAGMRLNAALAESYVVGAAANPRIRGNATADSMARRAVAVWQHVAGGDGMHNLPGADALLRRAIETAAGAYRQTGERPPAQPGLGPDPTVVSCVRCHYGVQTVAAAIHAQTFSHDEHVVAGALACTRCHGSAQLFRDDGSTFDPAHGRTLVAQADCASCHHVESVGQCATCHTRAEVATLRARADLTVHVQRNNLERMREVELSHDAHGSVQCSACHQPGPEQRVVACNECHESHHGGAGEAQACNACHTTSLLSVHEPTDHLVCGACHSPATLSMLERADRRFCLQCHTTMSGHESDGECSTCHLLIGPDEAMRQIVSARTIPQGRQ